MTRDGLKVGRTFTLKGAGLPGVPARIDALTRTHAAVVIRTRTTVDGPLVYRQIWIPRERLVEKLAGNKGVDTTAASA